MKKVTLIALSALLSLSAFSQKPKAKESKSPCCAKADAICCKKDAKGNRAACCKGMHDDAPKPAAKPAPKKG